MAKTKVSEWSTTPASNTDIDGINIAEGCAPSGINDAIRDMMAQIRSWQSGTYGDAFNGPVNGTIGATTPSTGAFTTLSASSTLSVTGVATLGAGAILNTPASVTLTNATGLPLTTGTTGTLATTKGGTGLTSFTANGVVYASSTSALATGSSLTWNGTQLGIGTSSPTSGYALDVRDRARVASTSNYVLDLIGSGANASTIQFYADNSIGAIIATGSSAIPLTFYTNGSEQMRLTSTGLGIGTSSPSTKLHVKGAVVSNFGVLTVQDSGGSGTSAYPVIALYDSALTHQGDLGMFAGDQVIANLTSTGKILFKTNSTTVGTIDTAGNLGLGVTPSAWSLGKAFEVGNTGNGLWGVGSGDVAMFEGGYYNSGWKYAATSVAAARYEMNAGVHSWYNAPSGTAGNAITFTQAMTLDASGNLGLGETSPSAIASGFTTMLIKGANGGGIRCGTTNQFYIYSDSTNAFLNQTANGYMAFATNNTERARIDSSGNLLVGTTSKINATNAPIQGYANGGSCIIAQQTNALADNLSIWNSATTQNNIFAAFYTETSIVARGSISYNRAGGLVAYNVTSDYRAKDIYGPVSNSGTLIDSVPVYMGKIKGATQERPMFIAHETPSYAHTGEKDAVDKDGKPVYQQMDASALIPVMWAELQSLRKRLADAGIA